MFVVSFEVSGGSSHTIGLILVVSGKMESTVSVIQLEPTLATTL